VSALRFPSARLGLRQSLAAGRLFEQFTERGFPDFSARLAYAHPAGAGVFGTILVKQPAGYFALQLSPEREMPDLAAAGTVDLTLTLEIPGRAPIALPLATTGAALAVVEETRTIAGQSVTVRRVAGAPFPFQAALPPPPVLLDGLALLDGDPETPGAGIDVTALGAPTVVTDAEGRFRIPALPLAAMVTLRFDDGATQTEIPFRPDYSRAAMTATFPLPSP
jgi:hypothetical protein